MPLYALAVVAGVGTLRTRFGGRAGVWATATALAVLLALPDLAWGVGGRVRPVQYPDAWQQVAATVPPGDGDVAVLPAGMYRRFEFSGAAPVLDPAPRMLRADVLNLIPPMRAMIEGLREDLVTHHADRVIRSLVVKLKFADFERTTAERAGHALDIPVFEDLLAEAWKRGGGRSVRLLGAGVRFEDPRAEAQLEFFGET